MLKYQALAYLGQPDPQAVTSLTKEGGVFALLATDQASQNTAQAVLKKIEELLLTEEIKHLNDFNKKIDKVINTSHLPIGFALSCGYLKDNLLYLKTVGEGAVFIKKGKQFACLITGSNSASGYVEIDDIVIYSLSFLPQRLGSEEELKKICLKNNTPNQIIDGLTAHLQANGAGLAALVVRFESSRFVPDQAEEKTYPPTEFEGAAVNEKTPLTDMPPLPWFNRARNLLPAAKNKKITLVVLAVIAAIFVWSVGLGVQRRSEAARQKKITATRQIIDSKLKTAEDNAFLNMPEALKAIGQARQELNKLKQELGQTNNKIIADLNQQIKNKEDQILKKENKPMEEFYDLAMDEKTARGDLMAVDQDNLAIVDAQSGNLFELSLSKKSLTRKTFTQLKKTAAIAVYQGSVYGYVPESGIYRVDEQQNLKKIVDQDKDWREVIAIVVYNSNLYLLDRGKDEVYKYLATETGFGEKNSYFKAQQAVQLTQARSLAIDSAVYIGFPDHIIKYLAGIQDNFSTSFPEGVIDMNKITTNKDLEKVYGWDKEHATVFVLNKNGSYEKQIKSSAFAKAADIVVFENNIYALMGSKINKVSAQ